MEIRPARGLRVKVDARHEAVFGDESVDVRSVKLTPNQSRLGILTGTALAGYCEVEMPSVDGKKHWYPIDELTGENGEKIVEEEVQMDEDEDDSED